MVKKIISMLLSICILAEIMPISCFATEDDVRSTSEEVSDEITSSNQELSDIISVSSVAGINAKNINEIVGQYNFSDKGGHGFAAERGNNLIEKIQGKNTYLVGTDDALNGADRKILNRNGSVMWIQDKYCISAKSSIDHCFNEAHYEPESESNSGKPPIKKYDGEYRYCKNGINMVVEVPADQYDDAVEYMKVKIRNGQVPNVTDPEEAVNLVKKGPLTYDQAKNLARAGTVESLTYDAATGTISAVSVFGISTIIGYTTYRLNGVDKLEALKNSAADGARAGAMEFGITFAVGQITKSGVVKILDKPTGALVDFLGEDFSKALLKASGENIAVPKHLEGTVVKQRTVAVLNSTFLRDAVSIVVFSIPDTIELFQNRISKKQFVKNLSVTAAGIAGGTAGAWAGGFVGSSIAPGPGTVVGQVVGGVAGGAIAGTGAKVLADYITDDDAEEMYTIVQNSFAQKTCDYILDEKEAQNIVGNVSSLLTEDFLKDMYQSTDRERFIEDAIDPLFMEEVSKRPIIEEPTEEEMRDTLINNLDDAIYIH